MNLRLFLVGAGALWLGSVNLTSLQAAYEPFPGSKIVGDIFTDDLGRQFDMSAWPEYGNCSGKRQSIDTVLQLDKRSRSNIDGYFCDGVFIPSEKHCNNPAAINVLKNPFNKSLSTPSKSDFADQQINRRYCVRYSDEFRRARAAKQKTGAYADTQEYRDNMVDDIAAGTRILQNATNLSQLYARKIEQIAALTAQEDPTAFIREFNERIQDVDALGQRFDDKRTRLAIRGVENLGSAIQEGNQTAFYESIGAAAGYLEMWEARQKAKQREAQMYELRRQQMSNYYWQAVERANEQIEEFRQLAAFSEPVQFEQYYRALIENLQCFKAEMEANWSSKHTGWLVNQCPLPVQPDEPLANNLISREKRLLQVAARKYQIYEAERFKQRTFGFEYEGVVNSSSKLSGFKITRIYPDSSAELVGLQVGDVITSYGVVPPYDGPVDLFNADVSIQAEFARPGLSAFENELLAREPISQDEVRLKQGLLRLVLMLDLQTGNTSNWPFSVPAGFDFLKASLNFGTGQAELSEEERVEYIKEAAALRLKPDPTNTEADIQRVLTTLENNLSEGVSHSQYALSALSMGFPADQSAMDALDARYRFWEKNFQAQSLFVGELEEPRFAKAISGSDTLLLNLNKPGWDTSTKVEKTLVVFGAEPYREAAISFATQAAELKPTTDNLVTVSGYAEDEPSGLISLTYLLSAQENSPNDFAEKYSEELRETEDRVAADLMDEIAQGNYRYLDGFLTSGLDQYVELEGMSVLEYAVSLDQPDVTQHILNHYLSAATDEGRDDMVRSTLLMVAEHNSLVVFDRMAELGVDTSFTHHGTTMLEVAMSHESEEILARLQGDAIPTEAERIEQAIQVCVEKVIANEGGSVTPGRRTGIGQLCRYSVENGL